MEIKKGLPAKEATFFYMYRFRLNAEPLTCFILQPYKFFAWQIFRNADI